MNMKEILFGSLERHIRMGIVNCSGGGGGDNTVKPTADQNAQQQVNAKLWNYYQLQYKPVLDKYVANTTSASTQAEEGRHVAGEINAEFMKNVKTTNASQNPLQSTMKLANTAAAETGAQVQGEGGVKSRQIADTQNVIDIGRGQTTAAVADLGQIAQQSITSEIANTEIQQQRDAAIENAYGSAAGAVAAGIGHAYAPTPTENPTPQVRTLAPQASWAAGTAIPGFQVDPTLAPWN